MLALTSITTVSHFGGLVVGGGGGFVVVIPVPVPEPVSSESPYVSCASERLDVNEEAKIRTIRMRSGNERQFGSARPAAAPCRWKSLSTYAVQVVQ